MHKEAPPPPKGETQKNRPDNVRCIFTRYRVLSLVSKYSLCDSVSDGRIVNYTISSQPIVHTALWDVVWVFTDMQSGGHE